MYTIFQDHEGGLSSNIRLNHISEEARPILMQAEDIYVVEVQGEDIISDYYAPIRIVRDVKSLIV